MRKHILTFYGGNNDQYGIPENYYVYIILSGTAPLDQDINIAHIISVTESPIPVQRYFTSKKDENVHDIAIKQLEKLPQLNGLSKHRVLLNDTSHYEQVNK